MSHGIVTISLLSNGCLVTITKVDHFETIAMVAKCDWFFAVVILDFFCLATVAMLVRLICNRMDGCGIRD